MTKDEALKLALEALKELTDVFLDTEGNHGDYEQEAINQGNEAIDAIEQALAQRKPLSNEEIYKIYRDCGDLNVKINIARAIEAAHGIKGEA